MRRMRISREEEGIIKLLQLQVNTLMSTKHMRLRDLSGIMNCASSYAIYAVISTSCKMFSQ